MSPENNLSKIEILAILLALFIFGGSAGLYLTHFPLARYLFRLEDEKETRQIGLVQDKAGTLRREERRQSEFRLVEAHSPLYDNDTVMTDPNSSATLLLEDGGKIELGPSTMVKLSHQDELNLGGISRVTHIQVVTGNVKTEAGKHNILIKSNKGTVRVPQQHTQTMIAPPPLLEHAPPLPSPSPSPLPSPSPRPQIVLKPQLLQPAPMERLFVPNGSAVAERQVQFSWRFEPPVDQKSLFILKKKGSHAVAATASVQSSDGQSRYEVTLTSPGTYEWVIEGEKGQPAEVSPWKSSFVLEPQFVSIQTLAPLIAGQKLSSNALSNNGLIRDFDLKLNWKPYPGVSDYKVRVFTSSSQVRPVLEKAVSGTHYTLNKNRVYKGKAYYDISATLPNGFVITSGRQEFNFLYLAPIPVLPRDGAMISMAKLPSSAQNLLMTWQSTNFTEAYELEISKSPEFAKTTLKQKFPQNFFIFKPSGKGTYWWRVRSRSNGVASEPSKPSSFTVID